MKPILKTALAVAAAGSVVAGGALTSVTAHHSFPATYHVDRTQTIRGRVVAFLFRNPHSFVQVMAPDADGTMQRWAVEWSAGAALASQNVNARTLSVGDVVTIVGNPGRNVADHRLRMNSIRRPADGWNWSGAVE
ncbi:DUF6152 family protein [Alteraurantiacibacter buctensis]|uniref:DUF5666 domain-containing protein n=1 Tax=Alteraurantiacibacter buctensis TaxID=1503981 RepID=A0A844Z207_9SPHN|nr:DUF6152 family protein [Alteraurantiacibacter buctensis]MXO73266.1 hypothetical protein [Alteraurantiacibacter buctensis]